jgi:hypothetical protein
MQVHGASVQILDLPGIIEGAKDGKGRGRQVIAGVFLLFTPLLYRLNTLTGEYYQQLRELVI